MKAVVAGIAVSLASVLLVGAGPVSANTHTFTDKRGDAAARHDITRVKVDVTKKRIKVKVHFRNLRWGAYRSLQPIDVYVDTRARRRGPEYMLTMAGLEWSLNKMKNWRTTRVGYSNSWCSGDRISYRPAHDVATATIPRGCTGKVRRARVNVVKGVPYEFRRYGKIHDTYPAWKRFSRWTRR